MKRRFKLIRFISKVHGYIYLLSRGRFGTQLRSIPFVMLTTTGSKSGKKRTIPLTAIPYGNQYILVASFGGSPTNPSWLTNIRRNQAIQIRIGTEIQSASARIVEPPDPEYDELWEKAVTMYDGYERYQKATSRKIPVVVLTPD